MYKKSEILVMFLVLNTIELELESVTCRSSEIGIFQFHAPGTVYLGSKVCVDGSNGMFHG